MKLYTYILSSIVMILMTACGGSSSSSPANAEVNSTYAYITDGSSMKIVDITDPTTPVMKGSVVTGSSFKVSVSDGYAYVSEFGINDPYVNIIDISDENAPTSAAAIPKGTQFGRVSDMYIEGNVAYVADEYRGIHIVDIGHGVFDPQALDGADAMAVTKLGTDLYLIHQGSAYGVQIYDVSVPYVLTAGIMNTVDVNAYSYPTPSDTHHSLMENDGTNIIVANVQDAKLKKLSAGLGLLGEVDIDGYATALAVSGNYAYVTMHAGLNTPLLLSDDAVKMIDLTSMTVVDEKPLLGASGVAVFDDKLYVADSTGLHIYDVSAGNLSLLVDFAAGAGNALALGK